MRAAYIDRLGPPENIQFGDVPPVRPGRHDVLVDVLATTVNPVDTFVRSGRFPTPLPFPFVVSRDVVGTVADVGAEVTGFAVGERVWSNSLGHAGRQGAAADQAVVPADRLYPLPAGADPIATVAVVHPGATAHLALFRHGRTRAGETVVVGGGAGNVGQAMIVLAAAAGARVITTAHPRDAPYCLALGAEHVVDYRDPQQADRLRELCPGGIDVHLDTSGTNDLDATVGLLAHRGRVVLLAGATTRQVLPVGALYMNDRSVIGFAISHATTDELAVAAAAINAAVAAPDPPLHPRSWEELPLSAASGVHRRMEQGGMHGRRVVLRTDLD